MQTDILKTILSPLFIQKLIKTHYNLTNIVDIILIRSSINDIYKVTTKNISYIFKIFSLNKALKDLEFEIKYTLYLKSNNILVSHPFKTVNNEYFVYIDYPEGKKLAILTNYIKGNKLEYMPNDIHLFGLNVARFHIVSNSLSIPEVKKKKYNIFNVLSEKKVVIESFLKQYHSKHLPFFSSFLNNLLSLKNIRFSKGYYHNDLHTDNTIKLGSKIYFFDFDFSGYGYLIFELSVFKWSCILNNKINLWEDFIKGYKKELAINTQELDYLYSFVAMRDILVMSFYIDRINIIGHKAINNIYINKRMDFLKSLDRQILKKGKI